MHVWLSVGREWNKAAKQGHHEHTWLRGLPSRVIWEQGTIPAQHQGSLPVSRSQCSAAWVFPDPDPSIRTTDLWPFQGLLTVVRQPESWQHDYLAKLF